ncbi:MerR family transcriptional regulator [Flexivirga alba]|uniref:MerR family transcriptional regulator n=1 Tax=Flexivirga alba TaxID=702742 RepID=A0ABW2ACB6_9MICO
MFNIGDFARHGRVSVRMLRHYDAIGLLQPAEVDPFSGYRRYDGAQLARLNRLVALKDLGFTLDQVGVLLDDAVTGEQLRGMLALRLAELEESVAADQARLRQVEARLRAIESESTMSDTNVLIKSVPSADYVELRATAASFSPDDIGPVVQPLCAELGELLAHAEATPDPDGRLTCWYDQQPDGSVAVHAGVPVIATGADTNGLTVTTLPGAEVAVLTHRGPMDQVMASWQGLLTWVENAGRRTGGPSREVYLETSSDPKTWVTELQEPIG